MASKNGVNETKALIDGFSEGRIKALAETVYDEAPLLVRLLQMGRPFICPLDKLVTHVPPGSTLLDIGCGAGLFALTLVAANRVSSAVAVDTNAKAIAAANRAAAKLSTLLDTPAGAIDFVVSNPDDDFPGGTYDVVSLIDVMHHVPRSAQRRFFDRVAKHVAPGGVLLYKDMCDSPVWKAWGNRLHDLVLARQWIQYVPLAKVMAWAKDLGLTRLHEEHYSRFFYGHELVVFKNTVSPEATT